MALILLIPFRIVQAPISLVNAITHSWWDRRTCYTIAVAGLDESKAQPLTYTLRRAASTDEERAIADQWLEALQVCQVANSLLLSELDEVEANLRFWQRREAHGNHFWFTLLRRGPAHFFGCLATLLSGGRRPPPGGGDAAGGGGAPVHEGDLVEKRVLIFRLLRSALCEALARVQASAGLLYLQQQQQQQQQQQGEEFEGEGEEGLFQRAARLVAASLQGVTDAFQQLERSVRDVLEAQQAQRAPPGADWQVLQGALSRVLGLHHLRRMWSRQQQQQLLQSGAAGAAAVVAGGEVPAVPALPPAGVAAQLAQARRAVGLTLLLPADTSVHSALVAAHRCAASMRGRRLIQVPAWALMPSQLQQHWIRYSLVGLAAGYGAVFLIRHSRLGGSGDLEAWGRASAAAVRGAWREHVVAPLASVKDELFNTFRRRPTITSMGDYEADRDSLQRMLLDFQRDYVRKRGEAAAAAAVAAPYPACNNSSGGGTGGLAAATTAAAGPNGSGGGGGGGGEGGIISSRPDEERQLLEGMALVMRTYESEMQRPLANLVGGELVRTLLIQVQKLKVDTASAMLEMDQILKANELSISLVAAVPALLLAGTSLYYLGRLATPTPPDPRREALPVRMAMVGVSRALEHVATTQEAAAAAAAAAAASGAAAEVAAAEREHQGLFAYRLAVAYQEADELFRRHRGLLGVGGSEWPNIRSDLVELASPATVAARMRTTQRMMRSYSIFQQF